MPDRSFITAVELQGTGRHPASWRRADSRAEDVFTAAYWTDLLDLAERAGIDFAFISDSFARGAHTTASFGQLDAASIAARAAAGTSSIGLIPTVTVTHTEPFHVSKQIASIDFASHGRAGWEVAVSPGIDDAKAFGRKGVQDAADLWREADDAIEVVTRLWDSWEDDAEIRDRSTGRFIDRDKLHYIDFAGDYFSVKGPSITPRSPQGQSIVTVRVTDEHSLAVAAARADVVRITAATTDEAAVVAARVRRAVVAQGRDPVNVAVLLDVDVLVSDSAAAELAELDGWEPYASDTVRYVGDRAGLEAVVTELPGIVDGVTFRPLALASGVGALPKAGSSAPGLLRERLGLSRPVNRYAEGAL